MMVIKHCALRVRQGLIAAVVALIATGYGTAPAAARAAQAPNSFVVLDLPDSFSPATQFSGFVDASNGASIVVLDLPVAAYAALKTGFSAENLAKRGVVDVRQAKLARSGEYIYMQASQKAGGRDFAKFFLVVKDAKAAALITVNVPKDMLGKGNLTQASIEQILSQASFADAKAMPADLFELGYLGDLKLAGRAIGTAKLYNRKGALPDKPVAKDALGEPFFIVAPSHSAVRINDLEAFSRRAIQTITGLSDIVVKSATPMKIDGLEAVALTANAQEQGGVGPVGVYQVVMSRPDGNYFRIIGQVKLSAFAKWQPEFEKMARSFRQTKPK